MSIDANTHVPAEYGVQQMACINRQYSDAQDYLE